MPVTVLYVPLTVLYVLVTVLYVPLTVLYALCCSGHRGKPSAEVGERGLSRALFFSRLDLDLTREYAVAMLDLKRNKREDRIGTGPPRARTKVIYVDIGCWAM